MMSSNTPSAVSDRSWVECRLQQIYVKISVTLAPESTEVAAPTTTKVLTCSSPCHFLTCGSLTSAILGTGHATWRSGPAHFWESRDSMTITRARLGMQFEDCGRRNYVYQLKNNIHEITHKISSQWFYQPKMMRKLYTFLVWLLKNVTTFMSRALMSARNRIFLA